MSVENTKRALQRDNKLSASIFVPLLQPFGLVVKFQRVPPLCASSAVEVATPDTHTTHLEPTFIVLCPVSQISATTKPLVSLWPPRDLAVDVWRF